MQDETSQATMSLMIRSSRVTAQMLRDAIRQILSQRNVLEGRIRSEHTERQTLRTLVQQGSELTNVRISQENIADFQDIARRYGIDYSLKRDRSRDDPGYRVFFRARDWETLWSAMEEYLDRQQRQDRETEPVSVSRQLEQYRQQAEEHNRHEKTRIPRYREEVR